MNEEDSTISTTTKMAGLPLRERNWFKFLLCILYSVIFVLGVGGNTIVCFIMYNQKKLRTVTNLFIFNLAISDLMFSGSIPLEFAIIFRDYEWPYATFFCKLYSPLQTIAVAVSIFTLTAVSIVRYRAINHPFKRQVSHTHVNYIIFAIWMFATLLMIPHFLTLKMNGNKCDEEWPHNSYRKIYTMILFVFFYLFPLFIILLAYTKIVKELKKKKNYHNTALNEAREKETSKVVRMIMKVTLLFAFCNFPSQLMWLWMDFGNAEGMFAYFWDLLTALNIFIFANSAANPLIYYIFHDKFQSEVHSYFKKFPCLGKLMKCGDINGNCRCSNQPLCLEDNVQVEKEMVKLDVQQSSSNKTSVQLLSAMVETNQESCV